MKYDFDTIIDRKNTNSLKYDFAVERGKPEDILPLWVADMDFKAPDEVLDALHNCVEHGIFGYSEVKQDYFDVLHGWFYEHFNWDTKQEWLIKTPGVVFAITLAIRAFTREEDGVLIQQPVYYPFEETIVLNKRKPVVNYLVYHEGNYTIDFKMFEQQIVNEKVKLFILCNPHNPVGRVWTVEELRQLGEICLKHGVLIVSDEIHCDFTYPGYRHTVFASIHDSFSEHTITCTSPSKTFNLAGLQVSNIFIQNEKIRKQFNLELEKSGYSQLNTLGLAACKAAYQYGGTWLEELKEYLNGNLTFLREYLCNNLPRIKLVEPEGTYLVWLDCSGLNLSAAQMKELIIDKAGLWLDSGRIFGKNGTGFERMNIACPRATLQRALKQLHDAVLTYDDGRSPIFPS